VSGQISNVTFQGEGWSGSAWESTTDFDRGLSYFSHGALDRDTVIDGHTIAWSLGMTEGLLLTTSGGKDVEGQIMAAAF
jgi:hypothetical protein